MHALKIQKHSSWGLGRTITLKILTSRPHKAGRAASPVAARIVRPCGRVYGFEKNHDLTGGSHVPFVRASAATRLRITDPIVAHRGPLDVDPPGNVVLGHAGRDRSEAEHEPRKIPHDTARRGSRSSWGGQEFCLAVAMLLSDLSRKKRGPHRGVSRHESRTHP